MRKLGRLVPRNLAVRRARTLLTALGIALGVAAIVATNVVRESATRSVTAMFDQAAGRADLSVTNATAGIVRSEGFDAAALERISSVDGVVEAAPLFQVASLPVAQLDEWRYSFISGNFSGAVIFGIDPDASRSIGHYRLTAGFDLDSGGVEAILLTESYAEELGVELGDALELVAPIGQARFTVSGLLAADGLARLNQGQVAVTALGTAQRVFERRELLDQVDIVVAPGTDVDALKGRLEMTLGDGFRVFRPASKGALVDQMLQSITIGMGFIGTLALVVGGFLIFNTFATTLAERTHELGLLRALGAGRGQVVGLVLVEIALIGLVGAGLGVVLGLAMASAMRDVAGATVNSAVAELAVRPVHVIYGLVTGVVVALLAGLMPAIQAGRLPVVESLQKRGHQDGHISRGLITTGLVFTLFGLVFTVGHFVFSWDISFELPFLILVTMLIGIGLLIPAVIPPLARLLGSLMGLLGVEARLGGLNLARTPGRAALTAGALMSGLASVIIIGSVASSATKMAEDYMDRALGADLWIFSPQPLPPSLAGEFEALPDVRLVRPAAAIPTRYVQSGAEGSETDIIFTAIDPQRSRAVDLFFLPDGGQQEEALAQLLAGGAVLISSPLREWYGLELGDTMRLQTLRGPTDFRVVGVTLDPTASGYSVVGSWGDAAQYFGTDRADIFALHVQPGIDASVVSKALLDRWGETYSLRIETLEDFRRRTQELSAQYMALSTATVLVAVVVAALGVANTLLMNVFERRREIGMLRSLGMTRGQTTRLVLSESEAMGILGGVLGIASGAWLSRFAVSASTSATGFELPYVFPVGAVITCVLIALVVPLLAGIWPAWRAARTNIVEAVRGE